MPERKRRRAVFCTTVSMQAVPQNGIWLVMEVQWGGDDACSWHIVSRGGCFEG